MEGDRDLQLVGHWKTIILQKKKKLKNYSECLNGLFGFSNFMYFSDDIWTFWGILLGKTILGYQMKIPTILTI